MAYVRGKSTPTQHSTGMLTIEQARRRNAELRIELQSLTAENAGLDQRVQAMRKDLEAAYIRLRRQIRDLDAVRAQQERIGQITPDVPELTPPLYGGREGLLAATEEITNHEYKEKFGKPRPASKGPIHGTARRYDLGCRCGDCKAWRKRKTAQYRTNRKLKREQANATGLSAAEGR